MRRRTACWISLLALALLAAAASGCGSGRAPEPVTLSRESLGTVVTVSLYGDDEAALRKAAERAFSAMDAVESELDAYDASSAVAAFNATPFVLQKTPERAAAIIDRAEALGVSAQFSPALWGVMRLYDFGGKQSVPSTAALERSIASSRLLARHEDGRMAFALPPLPKDWRVHGGGATVPEEVPHPGLDFGGALKGLALDEALASLRRDGVSAGLVTCGSTTIAFGRKPGGEKWRIGIEDPRKPGRVVAHVTSEGTVTVSTSGDYQQYFERDGVRYHHILDPATGRPARGLRSLTVVGAESGLDSDILSTALFVMGAERAADHADGQGLGLYTIDAEGNVAHRDSPKAPIETVVEPAR